MEKIFKLKEHGTTVRTEIMAGATTFVSMVYILAVNPAMLADAGMDSAAVFTATAVSAALFVQNRHAGGVIVSLTIGKNKMYEFFRKSETFLTFILIDIKRSFVYNNKH